MFKAVSLKVLMDRQFNGGNRASSIHVSVVHLYLKFLKEEPWVNKKIIEQKDFCTVSDNHDGKTSLLPASKQGREKHLIDPEKVVAWLTTQRNSVGAFYNEGIMRRNISSLVSIPPLLKQIDLQNRNVFECQTSAELLEKWRVFKTAKNYKKLDYESYGAFSAGLKVLVWYLAGLEKSVPHSETLPNEFKQASFVDESLKICNDHVIIEMAHNDDFKEGKGEALSKNTLHDTESQDVINDVFEQPNEQKKFYSKNVSHQRDYDLNNNSVNLEIDNRENKDPFLCPAGQDLNKLPNCPGHDNGYKTNAEKFSSKLGSFPRFLTKLISKASNRVFSTRQDSSTKTIKLLTFILSKRFSNGFRINSPIELMRFRDFALKDADEKLLMSDEELEKEILASGILFNGKVFIVDPEAIIKIKKEIQLNIESGAEIFFYMSFYERNEEWLLDAHVISEEMLRQIIFESFPCFVHRKNYFTPIDRNGSELLKIGREILRVWGEDIVLSYEQLIFRLPYIPEAKIKQALAQNREFIWNSEGVYTQAEKLDIEPGEQAAIEEYVSSVCSRNGYVSISEIPFGELAEKNYEFSQTAIQNAVFARVLHPRFEKKGKIVTKQGSILDEASILKDHYKSLEKCSLADLTALQLELIGESRGTTSLEAALSVMIRADENLFIADRFVRFNTLHIDEVLERIINSEHLPLKSITAFAIFPNCGLPWNSFLLESYCRRFSRRFRFDSLSVNSKNAGAVIDKMCKLSYHEIMANVVARSSISLKTNDVLIFLFEDGYIGRRSYSKIKELVELAENMREDNE